MDLAELTRTPYSSHWNAYASLEQIEAHFLEQRDRRAIFASVYRLTTRRMAESIDSGLFADTVWMQRYQTEFANHYRQALHHHAIGNLSAVPKPWRLAMDAAASGRTLIWQDVLLGMNAHINYDLPFAVEAVGIEPELAEKLKYHTAVNAVLSSVNDELIAMLGTLYGAQYAMIDSAMGSLDEVLLGTGMGTARSNAWRNAVLLASSRWWNRWLYTHWIRGAANTAAQIILAPVLTPTQFALLRELEGTSPELVVHRQLCSQTA
jgi:Family of unknown function (DUF5995)